jgi:hypothetical protein
MSGCCVSICRGPVGNRRLRRVALIGGSLVVGKCCCGISGSLALDTATTNFARHRDCEDV